MKKRILVGVLVVICAVAIYLILQPTPIEKATLDLFKAYKGLDNKAVNGLVEDKTTIETYDLANVDTSVLKQYLIEQSKGIKVKVVKVVLLSETKANVTVDIKYTDIRNIVETAYTLYDARKGVSDKPLTTEQARTMIEDCFRESIAKQEKVKKEFDFEVDVKKISDDKWKVVSIPQSVVEAYYSNVYGKLK